VIKPTVGELLSGVALSLRERVLPEIPPGTTRRQVQAAIGIIRRVALVCDQTGPYFYADNRDIEDTMRLVLPVLERIAAEEADAHLKAVSTKLRATLEPSAKLADPYPSPSALGQRNVELQELLAELEEVLHDNPTTKTTRRMEIDATLRALIRRMLARELEINSPARP
jgi:hypothetical protein